MQCILDQEESMDTEKRKEATLSFEIKVVSNTSFIISWKTVDLTPLIPHDKVEIFYKDSSIDGDGIETMIETDRNTSGLVIDDLTPGVFYYVLLSYVASSELTIVGYPVYVLTVDDPVPGTYSFYNECYILLFICMFLYYLFLLKYN